MNTGTWFSEPSRCRYLCLLVVSGCIFTLARSTATAEIISQARRIVWTPGVPGGIPGRTTICANVVANFGAAGNGVHDDAPAIQNAINACSKDQVVFIPAGTYRLNNQLQISKSIVLRGAGASKTFLKTYANWHGIQLGDFPSAPVATNVSGSPSKDATTITVMSIASPSLSVGDFICIDQINDGVEVINNPEAPDASRDGNTRSMRQITRITAINGQTLTINPPLYHAYSASQNPQVWKVSQGGSMTRFAGVEDLSIERISPTGTQGYSNIKMVACAYCWVKNIESKFAQFRHVDLDRVFECEVRDSFFNDGMHWDLGGFAYGVVSNASSANLIENNVFYHLRHSMVVHAGGSGNVYGYNYSYATYQGEDWLAPDMFIHGAHAHMNLFEGNFVDKLHADFTHGSGSYNTFFRNNVIRASAAMTITRGRRAVELEKAHHYYNIVGNVLGQSGESWTALDDGGGRTSTGTYVYSLGYLDAGSKKSADPQTKSTGLFHGNYDYATKMVRWDATVADHTLPNSLYLTAKPSWFGSLPWPSVGSDLTPMARTIPARERGAQRSAGASNPPPSAPFNLRIASP